MWTTFKQHLDITNMKLIEYSCCSVLKTFQVLSHLVVLYKLEFWTALFGNICYSLQIGYSSKGDQPHHLYYENLQKEVITLRNKVIGGRMRWLKHFGGATSSTP